MHSPRFFQDEPLTVGKQIGLTSNNFRHAIQVLRLKSGDIITLFNGLGGEFQACLDTISKRSAICTITSFQGSERESPLAIELALALIKPDKMDFAIQKAVELGVYSIQPIISQRTVIHIKNTRLEKKLSHWRSIMINACEQCGRNKIPALSVPISFEQYIINHGNSTLFGLSLEGSPLINKAEIPQPESIGLMIGPEGGFTQEEEMMMKQHSVQRVSLGKRVLRAETAALSSLVLIQSLWGDLQS